MGYFINEEREGREGQKPQQKLFFEPTHIKNCQNQLKNQFWQFFIDYMY